MTDRKKPAKVETLEKCPEGHEARVYWPLSDPYVQCVVCGWRGPKMWNLDKSIAAWNRAMRRSGPDAEASDGSCDTGPGCDAAAHLLLRPLEAKLAATEKEREDRDERMKALGRAEAFAIAHDAADIEGRDCGCSQRIILRIACMRAAEERAKACDEQSPGTS